MNYDHYTVIKGTSNLTVFLDGIVYSFPNNSIHGKNILNAIKKDVSIDEMRNIVNDKNKFKEYCKNIDISGVVITDNTILIDDEEISLSLAEQIRRHYNENISIVPIVNFIRKLRLNPSYRIREQMWNFIDISQKSGGFSLAVDGDILAYKKITSDYKDIYSNKIDNSIGTIVSMDRKMVDDDPNHTCSCGLHVCAYSYLTYISSDGIDKVVLVKVNPKDVVSIPTDYNYAKMRCCRYEVIREIDTINTNCVENVVCTDNISRIYELHTKKELINFYNMLKNTQLNYKKYSKNTIIDKLNDQCEMLGKENFIKMYKKYLDKK